MRKTEPCLGSDRDPVELLLRRIALGALHGSLLMVGCGDDLPNPGPGEYDPCSRHDTVFPVRAAELHLAQPADYVALRQTAGLGADRDAGADSWTRTLFDVTSEVGSACATATTNACIEKVAKHPDQLFPSYCPQACVEWSLVTTRGDDVQRAAQPEQILQQLGSIDSYDEALMLVASRGYEVTCLDEDAVRLTDPAAQIRFVRQVEGGYELYASTYAETCSVVVRRHRLRVSSAGEISELSKRDFKSDGVCIGRVPAGLVARRQKQHSFAEHLAACAHLEAASVFAFERLARELRAHGAPPALVTRALAAAREEVRHAQVIGELARAHGVEPLPPQVEDLPTRTLEEVALENAVEGCIRETYGAVVGAYQAARARDAGLRFAMRSIAVDEARHAALSHDVHAWLMPQLHADVRQRIAAAQRELIAGLRDSRLESELAGLPAREVAHGILDALQRALWNAA